MYEVLCLQPLAYFTYQIIDIFYSLLCLFLPGPGSDNDFQR